jgi:hypothetical protein
MFPTNSPSFMQNLEIVSFHVHANVHIKGLIKRLERDRLSHNMDMKKTHFNLIFIVGG